MTEKSLRGGTALITGAGKRLGRAIALQLAQEGVNIVIHYRSSEADARDLSGELKKYNVRSWPVKADFENPEEYGSLIARSIDAAGGLDILINNASIFLKDTLKDMDFASMTRHMQVNAWVPLVLSREFAKIAMRGKIVNFLDTRITGYDWNHVAYILSKHVLSVLTKMTALEFAPGITVNAVAPGLILPPLGKDESYLDMLSGKLPLERHGKPDDVVSAVMYLLKSDFLTGTVINVDGGRHLTGEKNGPHSDK